MGDGNSALSLKTARIRQFPFHNRLKQRCLVHSTLISEADDEDVAGCPFDLTQSFESQTSVAFH